MTGKAAPPVSGRNDKDILAAASDEDVGGVLYGETDEDDQETSEESPDTAAAAGAVDWEATGGIAPVSRVPR